MRDYFKWTKYYNSTNMKIIFEKNVSDSLLSSSKCSASRLSRTWHPWLRIKDLFSLLTLTASLLFSFSSSFVGSLSKHEVQMLLKETLSKHSPTSILTTDAENEKLPSPRNRTGSVVGEPIPGKNIIILIMLAMCWIIIMFSLYFSSSCAATYYIE